MRVYYQTERIERYLEKEWEKKRKETNNELKIHTTPVCSSVRLQFQLAVHEWCSAALIFLSNASHGSVGRQLYIRACLRTHHEHEWPTAFHEHQWPTSLKIPLWNTSTPSGA